MKIDQEKIAFLQDKRLIESRLIFDGHILQLYHNKIQLDNGQTAMRELIHHQSAVAILVTTDDNRVVLVSQYRPAIVKDFLEIPAGLLDLDKQAREEDPLIGAKRELEEETGYRANKWKLLGSYYLSPGYLNERITIYHAWDLEKVSDPLPQDEDEFVEVREFNRDEIVNMLANGKIEDMKTVLALNYWLNNGES